MMITANQLKKAGKQVTVYHDLHETLKPLFPEHTIVPYPENLLEHFTKYDQVIVENDNSAKAWELMRNRDLLGNLTFFYPTPSSQARARDTIFPKKQAIGKSIANATAKLLSITTPCMENGLFTPSGEKNKYQNRIVIHPTSADPKRNWKKKQFFALAKKLERAGYDIAFAMSAKERDAWHEVTEHGFSLPTFHSLKETAEYMYESGYLIGNDSGLGHLASNLGIPTLTISGNPKRVALWRPSWSPGKIATLAIDLPNFKGIRFRFREHFWQYFIQVNKVYRQFQELVHES